MKHLLLGVDGGATKTLALVTDETGTALGVGRAGSSDIHAEVAPEVAIGRVAAAVHEAAAAADIKVADLASCVFSLCGADWPEDIELYVGSLTQRLALRAVPTVMNDAFGALRAGTPDGIGVVLVVGTGAAVAARGLAGATWFSGERIEASGGQEFGRQSYDLMIRGEYGYGPVPGFQGAALEAFSVKSVEDLVYTISRQGGLGRRSLTRLAPVLLGAGHEGDPLARPIIEEQGALLAGYVRRAAARVSLDPQSTTVVISGGVFRHHGSDLMDAVSDGLAGFRIERSAVEPVYGALLTAADEHGLSLDIERLLETGPGRSFFDTM
ncbi:MAG: N-acetylglucosamine kinase [Chloroflexota bacterium]